MMFYNHGNGAPNSHLEQTGGDPKVIQELAEHVRLGEHRAEICKILDRYGLDCVTISLTVGEQSFEIIRYRDYVYIRENMTLMPSAIRRVIAGYDVSHYLYQTGEMYSAEKAIKRKYGYSVDDTDLCCITPSLMIFRFYIDVVEIILAYDKQTGDVYEMTEEEFNRIVFNEDQTGGVQ